MATNTRRQPPLCRENRGIHHRVMRTLMVFVVAVLSLLWVFQIVLLDEFYRWSKTYQMRQTSDVLSANIDNAELEDLMNHLAGRSGMCIVLLSEHGKTIAASEDIQYCLIHRMSKADRTFWCSLAPEDGSVLTELFNVAPQMGDRFNPRSFQGHVPQVKDEQQALLCVRRVTLGDGTTGYLLLNAIITPLDATVDTLRTQLVVITIVVLLGAVLLALTISRRLARPIIETNNAARSLSRGEYHPPEHGSEYKEMAELNQTLVLAAKELSRVDALQNELIANIGHDLRTPLTMIGGYAEVMRDIPGEATPENLQIVIDETARLTSLVSELLDFSRLQAGSAELSIAAFDLTDAVERIVQRVARMTEKDGYRLIFTPDEHIAVQADEERIEQVVYNLIGNALTYTGEDKTVTIRQMVTDGHVRIDVCDTGKGISEEELPLIWNRYYRAKESHRRAVIGSGLGLSIVQSILEKHGARYGVESTVGQGTRFWFELTVTE
ncbi:MAG: HAMP domain-containing sensor histidine kinase [Clostridiales bacterium]|nr:HAMP domain-containing sensor histidine kinase [Clostridiales bacterium]